MTVLFVSDLHLCPTRPVLTGLFCDFLKDVVPGNDALYLLGDIFEYWAGDDDLDDPFNARICAAIKACDLPKFVLPGNRDFLFGEAFLQATGSELLPDESCTTLPARLRCCCTATRYAPTTSPIRTSAAWCAARNGNRPSSPARWRNARRRSNNCACRANNRSSRNPWPSWTSTRMPLSMPSGATMSTTMIHGHTHRLASHYYDVDGKKCVRHVLGDWHEHMNGGNYLACSPDGWQRGMWWPEAE